MKRSTLGVIIAIVAVAALFVILFVMGKDASAPAPENNTQNNQTAQNGTDEAVQTSSVAIRNNAYSPATITVRRGTTVTWTNQDSVEHTVTPDEESDDFKESSMLGRGESYSVTFNALGTFTYHCAPHPNMTGTVIVTE